MRERLQESLLAILISIDILFCTIWQASLYPFNLASKPSGRRLISSFVGEAAYNRQKWGLLLEPIINFVFDRLEKEPEHCYRAFRKYEHIDD